MEYSLPTKGSSSKKKDEMNVPASSKKKDKMKADDLVDPLHQEKEKKIENKKEKKIGIKKDDDVEVEDPEVGKDFGKVDCTTGIVNWLFTLGPWEAILLKAIIMLFLAGCLMFLVLKLIKEGRLLIEKHLVEKKVEA